MSVTVHITNLMKRAFIVPATVDSCFASLPIDPGQTSPVDGEHWSAVAAGNEVIKALLDGRHLVVNGTPPGREIDNEALRNPASPEAPADLQTPAEVDGVKHEIKPAEVEKINVGDEVVDEVKAPSRRSRK